MAIIERLKTWSRELKMEALTVWYISKHPKTPWYTRTLAVVLVAYAFSPIDLIPDFIPVLGYVDDLIILPIGVLIMLRMTPQNVIVESRSKARAHFAAQAGKPGSRLGVALAVAGWVLTAVFIASVAKALFNRLK
jgi:uncharacterized membrane protein YkvA (DUF1232 family)